MSYIDRIPNELLEAILNFAMIGNTPFDINGCVRAAKGKTYRESSSRGWQTIDPSFAEHDRRRLWDIYRMERGEKERRNPTAFTSYGHPYEYCCWDLYEGSIDSQRPHILDWRLAGSVCKRWRKMGKIAFWAQKVIVMDLTMAKEIQVSDMTCLSKQDQQIAVKRITSIVLVPPPLSSPVLFLTLPKCIAGFPSLRQVDFYFGRRLEDPVAWFVEASQRRMQPPQHFLNVLSAIGICTETLDLGIVTNPSTNWTSEEAQLKRNINPLLIWWAGMKRAGAKKTMKALPL